MALNFPDPATQTPVNEFSPTSTPASTDNGVVYTWTGNKWSAAGSGGGGGDYLPISGGELTGDLTVPSLNGGQLGGFRNQLINGDFRIWQRGTASGTVVLPSIGGFTADRWATAGSGSVSSQRNRYGGIPVYESNGAGYIWQAVELYRDPTGDSQNVIPAPFTVGSVWTLSYYASVAPHPAISLNFQFRDTSSTDNANAVPIGTIELPTPTGRVLGSGNELVQYSTTFTVTGVPSDTNTCANFHIAGNAAFVNFAYAQLEPGLVATEFELRPSATELALAQRYFYAAPRDGAENPYACAYKNDFLQRTYTETLPTTMRVIPTVTASATNITGSVITFPSTTSIYFECTCSNAQSVSGSRIVSITADAEL